MSNVPRFITLEDLWEEFRKTAKGRPPESLNGHWTEEVIAYVKTVAIQFAEFTHRRAQELKKEEER